MNARLPTGTALGCLRIVEVYDFFDGPRLFSATSGSGATYLAFWVVEGDDADAWLYVAISVNRLDDVVEGAVSLRDAYTKPEDGVVFEVRTPFDGSPSTLVSKVPADIDDAALPLPGDFIAGRRVPFGEPVGAIDVSRTLMQGRVQQRLTLEGRGGQPVSFGAVTATLSRWQQLFSTTFGAAGGKGALIPVAAQPGSFKLTLTVPKGAAATHAFGHVRRFAEGLSGDTNFDPRRAKIDAREFDDLVAALRDHELKLTLEQDSAADEPLGPIVLDLRTPAPIERAAHDVASRVLASIEIPQADDLDRVVRLIELVSKGTRVRPEDLDVVPRQVAYYKQAGRVLRLLDDNNELSTVGEQVLSLPERSARLSAISVQFETSRCGWAWVKWSQGGSLLDIDVDSAEAFLVGSVPELSASTAKRRARTLETWCTVLQPYHFLHAIRGRAPQV